MQIDRNVFDPSLLSFPDIDFLLAHAGESPLTAFRFIPPGVNSSVVRPWIERFNELIQLKESWIGVDGIRKAIEVYLDQRQKWQEDHEKYGAPKFPSLYAFDSRGNAHLAGAGSDSGRVKTYFDSTGQRLPFAVSLNGDTGPAKWIPEWARDKKPEDFKLTETAGSIVCGVAGCGHAESFREGVRSSWAAARARMSRHLRRSETEKDAHFELYTLEFGS